MSFLAPTVQGAEYFAEIEETFVRRRGANLFLSPKDWALMDEWLERGIPLFIVIRSINAVFDVLDKRPMVDQARGVSSLKYCEKEVEAQYLEWTAAQVGSSGERTTENGKCEDGITVGRVTAHIDGAIEQLRAVDRPELRLAIDVAVNKLLDELLLLGDLKDGEVDWQAVDEGLNAIDKDLEAALQTTCSRAEVAPIEAAIKRQLAEYDNIDEASYQRTFTMMLLKQLREQSGIPRLGLFYL